MLSDDLVEYRLLAVTWKEMWFFPIIQDRNQRRLHETNPKALVNSLIPFIHKQNWRPIIHIKHIRRIAVDWVDCPIDDYKGLWWVGWGTNGNGNAHWFESQENDQ